MKKSILILGIAVSSLTVFSTFCSASASAFVNTLSNAAFSWAATAFDFGSIKQNVPVSHTFTFKNNGSEPLIISSVQASCGCTIANYSKDPVAPGGVGFVKATYNAAKPGAFTKTVTVHANTNEEAVLLTIKGTVVE